ncbi:MAG: threonine/serine dehydratase [Chloroflexi bacterium]|nr:threonine/serine dehydratase [Chloroflexota bacterium]
MTRFVAVDRGRAALVGPADPGLVTIEDIRAAAIRLRGIALRTPLVEFAAGPPRILLKAESLQAIGAFKIRGAYNAIAQLGPEERERGVVTHSSGNHAQGVARAARMLGVRATVVMPEDAPAVKRARVAADGAEIVTVGVESGAREAVARRLVEEQDLVLIPPYDDDRVIAGQGTCGLEIAEDVADLGLVLVPIGGGGLASGVAAAVRALRPDARVVGVEPELAADAAESLEAGRIIRWEGAATARTIADGTRTQAIGERPFAHLSRLLDGVVTVSETEIAIAMRLAAEQARLIVEPSGALSLAAAALHAGELGLGPASGTVVAVISGGNVDPERYRSLLETPAPD